MLRQLFARSNRSAPIRRTYDAVVAQSRLPYFFTIAGVPDTVYGRFDVLVLNAFPSVPPVGRAGAGSPMPIAQSLFDWMFADMDRNLRELGVRRFECRDGR